MFLEVQTALKLDQHSTFGKRINLVEEESDLGGFLVHHFIASALKSDRNLVLLGLDQTLGHYHGVGLKLGVDILKKQKSGHFVFVDLLKSVSNSYYGETEALTPGGVYQKVIQSSQEFNESRPLTIIIDKLTLFNSLGFKTRDTFALLQGLQAYSYDSQATLITLSRGHSSRDLATRYRDEYDLDGQSDALVAFLDHTSNLTVVVWPLSTGHSEVVSGNLLFSWKGEEEGVEADRGRFQYNIEDKNVRVFALGTSRAVL